MAPEGSFTRSRGGAGRRRARAHWPNSPPSTTRQRDSGSRGASTSASSPSTHQGCSPSPGERPSPGGGQVPLRRRRPQGRHVLRPGPGSRRCGRGPGQRSGPAQEGVQGRQQGGHAAHLDRPVPPDGLRDGVDLQQAAAGRQHRRGGVADAVVLTAGQQEHRVGPGDGLAGPPQGRIGQPPGVIHEQAGEAGAGAERRQAGLRRRAGAGRPDQHEGASRLLQQAQNPADGLLVRRVRGARSVPGIARQGVLRPAAGGASARRAARALQDVHRQAEVHRARRPRGKPTLRHPERGAHQPGHLLRTPGHLRPAREGPGQAHLVHLLEGPLSGAGQGGVAAEQQQGRLPGPGHGQGAQGVGVTGPRRDEGHPHLAGQAGPAVRHVHGGALVPGVDDPDPGPVQGLVEREHLVPGEAEHPAHAGPGQRPGHGPGPRLLRHHHPPLLPPLPSLAACSVKGRVPSPCAAEGTGRRPGGGKGARLPGPEGEAHRAPAHRDGGHLHPPRPAVQGQQRIAVRAGQVDALFGHGEADAQARD